MKDLLIVSAVAALAVVVFSERPEAKPAPVVFTAAPDAVVEAPRFEAPGVVLDEAAAPPAAAPVIRWEGATPEQINGVWHRRSRMVIPPEQDAGECLPQPGDKTMSPEYLDRPDVIDGRIQPEAQANGQGGACQCASCSCPSCPQR